MTIPLALALAYLLASCTDDPAAPLPALHALPSCASLGCADLSADRACATTGACACQPDRAMPAEPCAAFCVYLPCAAVTCGLDGVALACTCALPDGDVACHGDPLNP